MRNLPVGIFFTLLFLFCNVSANEPPANKEIHVFIEQQTLVAVENNEEVQGDQKTPEGHYILDYKNAASRFYKSIHVSYPNAKDRANARRLGVDPGGDIMLHGQPNGWGWASPVLQLFSWTEGCVALSNKDMDKIWLAVDPGTPIEIRPN